ncbi:MAG TPA: dihydrodipicolinate synthase family protein, partial [Povalibacter sp.]|nr:dihydrodipicolinate synthase family protein [Povalibacter sp.]
SGLGTRGMLYAGITGLGIEDTVRNARWAAEDGADVGVLMAPFFLWISQPQLQAFARAVADASPLPIALYHHQRAATAFDIGTITELARHPNIVAMKDTSNDIVRFRTLLANTQDADFSLFQGHEARIGESFEAGACGCVSALSAVMPEWYVEALAAAQAGEHDVVARMQKKIDDLMQIWAHPTVTTSISGFTRAVKLGLRARGWLENLDDILPGLPADPAFERAVRQTLEHCGVKA